MPDRRLARASSIARRLWIACGTGLALAFVAAIGEAQASRFAVRFHGTGMHQQDRVRIPIDDDAPGGDASAPCDVGSGSFTIELWLRGELADNATQGSGGSGGGQSFSDARWLLGNILLDRHLTRGCDRDFGISVAGGRIRFGTGAGDIPPTDRENTIEGRTLVLDGSWHHVAAVRDAGSGEKSIYVDGLLDYRSPSGVSQADLSYPDDGAIGQTSPYGPTIVLAAEKNDALPGHRAFNGFLDELRIWSLARTSTQIGDSYDRLVRRDTAGLVASYRFEEGGGSRVSDSSDAHSPAGVLIANLPGNGEWVSFAADPGNTAPVTRGALPVGFQRSIVAGGFLEPTVLRFAPDGRLFVGERGGRIRVVTAAGVNAAPLLDIDADTQNGERGLLGLALDPQFATNGFLYAYYTTDEPRNRVSRFTVIGDSASPLSEVLVWENPALAADYHHAGALGIGPDGCLYIATGDQFISEASQDLSTQHGKILRIHRDGSVPLDNPFVGVAGARPEIWARGLRNPFRFVFDSANGAMFIGDVGGNSASSFEEIDRGAAGADFGWPEQEGPLCFSTSCASLSFPPYSYRHNDPAYAPGVPQAAIIAGPVYRANAFPAKYQGNLFISDYANGWIRRLVLDAAGNVLGDPLFDAPLDVTPVVDMAVGPEGALYVLTYDEGADGEVHRIAYGGSGNHPPIAQAGASISAGPAPLSVQFQGSTSHDPDAGPSALTFTWQFGDGATSTAADPVHVYASSGVYTATLLVSDGAATSSAPALTISAGWAPRAVITTPALGATYRAGDTIRFDGSAEDTEDGPLLASALTWRVVLVHAGHTHPYFGPVSGIFSGSFTIPASGHGPEHTHYRVELLARDSDGLTVEVTRVLRPVASHLSIKSVPPGIPLYLDGEARVTPFEYESLVGFEHALEAQPVQALDGHAYAFAGWSSGASDPSTTWTAPPGGGVLKAYYAEEPPINIAAGVTDASHNAEYWLPTGEQPANYYDGLGLCCGRDGAAFEMAFEFALDVPAGSVILSASVEVTATPDQVGWPTAMVKAYDTASLPPFAFGSSTPLTAFAPLSSGTVAWHFPHFSSGNVYRSPDLSALVQSVVSRADWSSGNLLGIVLDGASSAHGAWRCVRNFASGSPPRLMVTFGSGGSGSTLPPLRHR